MTKPKLEDLKVLLAVGADQFLHHEVEPLVAALTDVLALAEKWNSTPDYTHDDYDQGRVDQRHDMTEELFRAITDHIEVS